MNKGSRQSFLSYFKGASSLGVIALDDKGTIVAVNDRLPILLGHEKKQLAGKNIAHLLFEESRFSSTSLGVFLRTGQVEGGECQFIHANGDVVPLLVHGVVASAEVASDWRFCLFLIDIKPYLDERETWKTNYEEQVELTKSIAAQGVKLYDIQEKLKELNQMKDDYLAVCSHDLRSPIGILKTGSELLLDGTLGELNADQVDMVQRMERQANFAIGLVSDLLDLSKVEHGLGLDYTSFNFVHLLEECVDRYQLELNQKAIQLSIDSEFDEINVYADVNRMTQVITNLIGNAIKYVDKAKGMICLSASVFVGNRKTDSGEMVLFSIWNNGASIPEDRLDKVFNKYEQARKSDAKIGTGLGLAICKYICKSHRGNIWAESDGSSSNFFVTLPFVVPSHFDVDKLNGWYQSNKKNLTTLLIQSDLSQISPTQQILTDAEMLVIVCQTGSSEIRSLIAKRKIDLILCDLSEELFAQEMTFLQATFPAGKTQQAAIFLQMVPNLLAKVESSFRDISGVVFKPVSAEEVLFKVKRILMHQSLNRTKKINWRAKILVLDREKKFREIIGQVVNADYEVIQAKTSYEALFFIRKHYFEKILLHIEIPDDASLGIAKRIRKLDLKTKIYLYAKPGQPTNIDYTRLGFELIAFDSDDENQIGKTIKSIILSDKTP